MVEVVKPGRIQKGWSKKFTCTGAGNGDHGCGAVLLVSAYDIYETSSTVHAETDYYRTFCCPQCGVETDIPTKDWPPSSFPLGKRPSDAKRKRIGEGNLKRLETEGAEGEHEQP